MNASRVFQMKWLIPFVALCGFGMALPTNLDAEQIDRYNVVWDRPSEDATGQMPLGNGDIAAGVYAIEDGELYLLLSKNDAFTYNGDLFKTGRVKVTLRPNPFEQGKPFQQVLDLETGSIRIEADGVHLRIWADAMRPVYHVQIQSPHPVSVRAESDLWERIDGCQWNKTMQPIDPPTQDVRLEQDGSILWSFSVGDRSVYPTELKFYDVEQMASVYPDPYRFNTFGNLLESRNLELSDGALCGDGQVFDLRIHALATQTADPSDWVETIQQQADQQRDSDTDWATHCEWWSAFWDRSWITITDNTLPAEQRGLLGHEGYSAQRKVIDRGAIVAQSYNVFRFLMACQSRGRIQTKFNGGLFTQPLRYDKKPRLRATQRDDGAWISHEDDRLWGRRFTFQNQRLLYWPLLMSGDGDLMKPFFDYYWNMLPMRRAITHAWFGHGGAYYRENLEPTGGERDCGKDGSDVEHKPLKTPPGGNDGSGYYHSYYFTSGLETVAMMIDYVKYSGDQTFQDEVLAPFAREILLFFDKHYGRDLEGKLRIDPAMVLETWWIAVNPAPDVSGLQHCLDELLSMNVGSSEDQRQWARFRKEIPEVHLQKIDGRLAIAPAQSWEMKKNSENGLLYPVFPFRRFGLGLGTRDIVDWTMQHRTNKDRFGYKCWTQDQIHWAFAGNALEARDGLVHRFTHASPLCRFPLYGSEGPDSCPDFDHFGSGSTALQRMLLQEANGKILLLPAWPSNWDAQFKLHLTGKTVVRGQVTDGKLVDWEIEPAARRGDVMVYEPQSVVDHVTTPDNSSRSKD
ncbi:DUF5703 domain-containing protein [Novipirellula artificiosorum]|uniref:DUF5703 domain-containing protein n=1 Tax=Novipirellula artificiosorum TaxID=2528016 RepID=A0A5C6D883_9BACT|nr:DUF5703 domain-containing protein [Novipirellula artificiosorum]TWU31961.1 hypothetical protein Poly41_58490 [Novipirellula artificiosorum]